MPRKACCCNVTPPPPPTGVCLPIPSNCIGQRFRITADFKLRYYCFIPPAYDTIATYTACGGQVFSMKRNFETWRLTWEHTISTSDTPFFHTTNINAGNTEYSLQKISPGISYLTIDVTKLYGYNINALSYNCDDYYVQDLGCNRYFVNIILGIGYKETLPCGDIWEYPYVPDDFLGTLPCGNQVSYEYTRGIATTAQTCIATSVQSGTKRTGTVCPNNYYSEYVTRCGQCILSGAYPETTDNYIPSDAFFADGSAWCSTQCNPVDSSVSQFVNTHWFGYRTLLVEKI